MLQPSRNLGVSCAMNVEDSARAEQDFEQLRALCCTLYLQKPPLNVASNEEDVSPLAAARTCCILSSLNARPKREETLDDARRISIHRWTRVYYRL